MIFDTHAHYNDEAFDEDRDELLKSLPENGVELVVNVGANLSSTEESIALAEQYGFIYAAAGVHPSDSGELTEDNFCLLESRTTHKKVVAIGEIGLDYYWDEPDRQIQKEWFARQIQLAKKCGLPIVVHSRDAAKDTLDILKAEKANEAGGIIHCFSYGTEMAREFLNLGFYLGIGGVLTFKNAKKLKEVAAYAPLDRIVLETDCPYMAPVPNRGKRNSSLNLPYVAEELSRIKGAEREEIERITFENGKKLYQMP